MKKAEIGTKVWNIGIIGMDKGEGVTSLAVGLASYLHEVRCMKTALVELNTDGDFDEIREVYFGKECFENPFQIFKIFYYPAVTKGQYAKICNMRYECIVTDFGSQYQKYMEDFMRCDLKIVLGSVNLWKYRKYMEFYEYIKDFPGVRNWLFLLSGDEEDICMLHAKYDLSILNREFFGNPYNISTKESEYYEKILRGQL